LPDLRALGIVFAKLNMSGVGAGIPTADYNAIAAHAVRLTDADQTLATARLAGVVLSYRDWVHASAPRYKLAHQWRQFFTEWDVVLCPVMPTTAFPHDHTEVFSRTINVDGVQIPYVDQAMWSSIATLTGQPSTAMPAGLGSDGLPIGVQIIGPYLEDRTTLGFAALAEREFGGFVAPPG
jgi:amidase